MWLPGHVSQVVVWEKFWISWLSTNPPLSPLLPWGAENQFQFLCRYIATLAHQPGKKGSRPHWHTQTGAWRYALPRLGTSLQLKKKPSVLAAFLIGVVGHPKQQLRHNNASSQRNRSSNHQPGPNKGRILPTLPAPAFCSFRGFSGRCTR